MQTFIVSNFGVGRPSFLSLAGNSVIGLQTMLSSWLSSDEERKIYQTEKGMQ
jgi:hypothetical protein